MNTPILIHVCMYVYTVYIYMYIFLSRIMVGWKRSEGILNRPLRLGIDHRTGSPEKAVGTL